MRYKYTIFLALLVILLLSTFFISGRFFHSARAAGQFAATDVGNLPPLVRVSRLLGSDQPDRILQMSVGLGLRNQDQLDALLRDLYDPSSPGYHQFLSVDEFAQRFGPTADQQLAVKDYLTQHGFSVTRTYPNHLLIDFSGQSHWQSRFLVLASITTKARQAAISSLMPMCPPCRPTLLRMSLLLVG